MKRKIITKALLINEAGKILCLIRSKSDAYRPGEWDFPGGKPDPGESLDKAVRREVLEEVGIQIRQPELVFATTLLDETALCAHILFVAHVAGQPAVTLSPEHESYEWASLAELRAKPSYKPFHDALAFCVEHDLFSGN